MDEEAILVDLKEAARLQVERILFLNIFQTEMQ